MWNMRANSKGWEDINMQILCLHCSLMKAIFGWKNMAVVPYPVLTPCYLLLCLRRVLEIWKHNFEKVPEIQEQLLNRLHATQNLVSLVLLAWYCIYCINLEADSFWDEKQWPVSKVNVYIIINSMQDFLIYPSTYEADSVRCACFLTLCDRFVDALSSRQMMTVHVSSLFHSFMIKIGSTGQNLSWS